MSQVWRVRLSNQAEQDLLEIAQRTTENFGARQAEQYVETMLLALDSLSDGPLVIGSKARDELGLGIRTLHMARQGRKGRHFVVFRQAAGNDPILDILRFLHDSMDLARHLPAANDSLKDSF